MSGRSPDQVVIVSACVRGYTITHPVPSSELFLRCSCGKLSGHSYLENNNNLKQILFDGPLTQGDFFACYLRFSPRRRPHTIETKLRLYKCALREIPPDCQFVDRAERLRHKNGKMICCPFARILRSRGGCGAKNHPRVKCGCALRRFSPSSRNSALLRRAERHKTAAPLRAFRRKSRDRMCICRTAHTQSDKCHLVRAAPRHPANVSRSQIEICQRSPFYDSSNRKSWGPAPPAWVPIL